MHDLLRKIHMYLGLLSWSSLIVFGIAGLTATLHSPSDPRPALAVRMVEFSVAPNSTDADVADAIWKKLAVPFASPPGKWSLRRDSDNHLVVSLWSPNGVVNATVIENEARLRVETQRNSLAQAMNNLHAMTTNADNPGWAIRMWTVYNEFAIWTLLAMALTGVALWLTSRPRFRLAQVAFLSTCVLFGVLYYVMR